MNIADHFHSISSEARGRGTSRLRFAQLFLAVLVGAALTFVVFAIVVFVRRGPLTPLTEETFKQAERTWISQSIDNYDIEIRVTGRQASTYRVEVRGGEPRRATRNGEPLGQKRTWSTWTVPGMFGTLQADLRNMARLAAGDKNVPRLTVQAQFDERYGFPRRYVRVESVQAGGNPEVTWEVIKFLPNPGANAAARSSAGSEATE